MKRYIYRIYIRHEPLLTDITKLNNCGHSPLRAKTRNITGHGIDPGCNTKKGSTYRANHTHTHMHIKVIQTWRCRYCSNNNQSLMIENRQAPFQLIHAYQSPIRSDSHTCSSSVTKESWDRGDAQRRATSTDNRWSVSLERVRQQLAGQRHGRHLRKSKDKHWSDQHRIQRWLDWKNTCLRWEDVAGLGQCRTKWAWSWRWISRTIALNPLRGREKRMCHISLRLMWWAHHDSVGPMRTWKPKSPRIAEYCL